MKPIPSVHPRSCQFCDGKAIQTTASILSMTDSVSPMHHHRVNNLVESAASNLEISLTVQLLNVFGWLRKNMWPVWNALTSQWTPLCWIMARCATGGDGSVQSAHYICAVSVVERISPCRRATRRLC